MRFAFRFHDAGQAPTARRNRIRNSSSIAATTTPFCSIRACRDLAIPAAELVSSDGRLALQMFTSPPALQLYGGNYIAGTSARAGGSYADYAGVALEAEFPPDSPHYPNGRKPTASCARAASIGSDPLPLAGALVHRSPCACRRPRVLLALMLFVMANATSSPFVCL